MVNTERQSIECWKARTELPVKTVAGAWQALIDSGNLPRAMGMFYDFRFWLDFRYKGSTETYRDDDLRHIEAYGDLFVPAATIFVTLAVLVGSDRLAFNRDIKPAPRELFRRGMDLVEQMTPEWQQIIEPWMVYVREWQDRWQ